jgi:DNA-directed RNA polymerase subunit M/transcription elongation factor TFIIS
MKCPDCDAVLGVTTKDEKGFFHIYEICANCGYIKAFVDYKDNDTGSIVWSGLDC